LQPNIVFYLVRKRNYSVLSCFYPLEYTLSADDLAEVRETFTFCDPQ